MAGANEEHKALIARGPYSNPQSGDFLIPSHIFAIPWLERMNGFVREERANGHL